MCMCVLWVRLLWSLVSAARPLLSSAADKGSVPAQCDLGKCYLQGTGVAKDTKQAVRYLRGAAEAADAGQAAARQRHFLLLKDLNGVPHFYFRFRVKTTTQGKEIASFVVAMQVIPYICILHIWPSGIKFFFTVEIIAAG